MKSRYTTQDRKKELERTKATLNDLKVRKAAGETGLDHYISFWEGKVWEGEDYLQKKKLRRQARRAAKKQSMGISLPRAMEIKAPVEVDLPLQFAKEFYEEVVSSIPYFKSLDLRVVWGTRRISCAGYQIRKGVRQYTIKLGSSSILRSYETGFREYKTLQYLLRDRGVLNSSGKHGIMLLIIHELAHIANFYLDQRGDSHGPKYRARYEALLDRYFPREVTTQ